MSGPLPPAPSKVCGVPPLDPAPDPARGGGASLPRRRFVQGLAGLGLVAAGLPLLSGCDRSSGTKQAARVPRIGFLAGVGRREFLIDSPFYVAFRQTLAELGWVDGQNIAIEYRFTETFPSFTGGLNDRFPVLAAELVGMKVDVLVAEGYEAIGPARRATATIPIVMIWGAFDPVAEGLAASWARPGGNVTGTTAAPVEYWAKSLELFKEAVPGLSRVRQMHDAASWGPYRSQPKDCADESTRFACLYNRAQIVAARDLRLDLDYLDVYGPDDIRKAIADLAGTGGTGLIVGGRPLRHLGLAQTAELALAHRLPTLSVTAGAGRAGALLTYVALFGPLYRRAAVYVDKILKGARPGDLPIEQPSTFDITINVKTAQALGLTIPQSVLLQATEVIQ
jgi:putative ABC transport system substrate-binding protein